MAIIVRSSRKLGRLCDYVKEMIHKSEDVE